ncbi:hypothetical protein K1T71_003742 [Dendrolimus kikuchii]|uniref:Uncharacterized protein n=1 Tax=Dendrolimus kikuchii TaxID=765133 RepID=A0ACC1D8R2_9NEOP|nr:hypothetical protein K1T71_003742 [Dendrolimus kikuchii]
MSYIKVLHCTLCLRHGSAGLSTKSNGTLSQQVARISTSYCWQSKLSLTTQTQTTTSAKSKNVTQDTRVWKETPSYDRKNNLGQYCMMLSKFRLTCKPVHAISFAALTSTAGLSMLYFGVNPLTAALGAGNLILYTSVYTPMKRMSILNTWLGSVVGAIPPLMGWAGCTGSLDAGALVLGIILFSWQFPHFNALSWNLRPDYSRAGYRMMAVTDPGLCRRVALRHTGVITATCLGSSYLEVTNMWFALESLPLNIYFMYLAWQFYQKSDSGSSRKLFRFSLIHLPALMLLMLINKKYWSTANTQEQAEVSKSQDVTKLPDKRISVLPRGPVVAAQDTNGETT